MLEFNGDHYELHLLKHKKQGRKIHRYAVRGGKDRDRLGEREKKRGVIKVFCEKITNLAFCEKIAKLAWHIKQHTLSVT